MFLFVKNLGVHYFQYGWRCRLKISLNLLHEGELIYDYVLNQIRKFALVRSQKAEVFNWFSDPLYCSVYVRDMYMYVNTVLH